MIDTVFKLLLRLVVLTLGLVFLALLVLMAMGLLGLWLLRALWSRVLGRPVAAWQFDFKRYARRYPFQGPGHRRSEKVLDVEVIDVEAKPQSPVPSDRTPPGIESEKHRSADQGSAIT